MVRTIQATFCLLMMGICALVLAQAPAAKRPAASRTSMSLTQDRVGGRVVSSVDGHAIPNAVVTLQESASASVNPGRQMRSAGRNSAVASARTDAEGRYRFAPQSAGKYSLHASAAGYLSAAYQEHEGFSTAIVLGAGLPTDMLVLSLAPSAAIAGRVLDEAGDAVQHAQLTLYREAANGTAAPGDESGGGDAARVQRARSATTSDDGTFEFASLPPGRFYLSVSAAPWYATHPRSEAENNALPYRSNIDPSLNVAYPELFYPSATDPSTATPLVIKAGDRLTANFVMQPEPALTLTVRLPPGETPGRFFPQLTRNVFGNTEPVLFQVSGQSGRDIVFAGIPPGHYDVQAFSPGNRVPQSGGGIDMTGGSTSIDLPATGAGETSNVHVTLHMLNGASLPAELQLSLRSARPAGTFGPGALSQHIKSTNEAVLPNVPAGDYRFTLFSEGRPIHVMDVTSNGKKSGDAVLHVRGSGDVSADLTVTTYAPAVEGFVQRDGKGVPATMVVLVPAGADSSRDLFRRDQSDLDGSFHLNNVVPGNYLLVAIDDGWKLPRWNDASALASYLPRATPVTVAASGSNTVHVAEAVTAESR